MANEAGLPTSLEEAAKGFGKVIGLEVGTELPGPFSSFFQLDTEDASGYFHVSERGVGAEIVLGAGHEGAVGLAHGGIISALIDHVIGQACMVAGHPAVTRELTIRYLRPAYLGRPLTIDAWVDKVSGRHLTPRATVEQDGKLIIEAHGDFIVVDMDRIIKPRERDAEQG